MKRILWALGVAFVGATAVQSLQAQASGERFGLGTFRHEGRTFVGVVMRFPTEPHEIGGVVVELPAAAKTARVTGIPNDLMGIIEQWATVGPQIKRIVSQVGPQLDSKRPAYVYDFKAVDAVRPFLP